MHNQPRKMESNTFMSACMCMCVCMCPCLCTLAINNSQTNKGLHMKLFWYVINVMINQSLVEVKVRKGNFTREMTSLLNLGF